MASRLRRNAAGARETRGFEAIPCSKLAAVSHPPARTDLACRNCGTQAPSKFCPECGQETALHPPTLGEFLHEFAGHYVALEGELWRTLAMLLRRPGRLTREYLDGRRRRYVLPLRLYLTASFLFFLVLKLTAGAIDHETIISIDGQHVTFSEYEARSASGAASGALPRLHLAQAADCGGASQPSCNRVQAFMNDLGARFEAHPQETIEHMRAHFLGLAPYAIFFLLPVFSGVLALAYRNRGMTYGEHFVFSLHLHAFWFIALLVIHLLPDALGDLLDLGVPIYGVWAMREAYGGRWLPTIARALFISVLYGAALALTLVVLSVTLLATS